MSFLGKFFAAKAEAGTSPGQQGNTEDGPPLPKKPAFGDTGAPQTQLPPSRKFERPVAKPRDEAEETRSEPTVQEDPVAIEHQPEETERPESHPTGQISGDSEKNVDIGQSSSNITPGKGLTFLQKMKLKREQEALEKSVLETSQIQETTTHNDESLSQPKPAESEVKPKFSFMNKFKQAKEPQPAPETDNILSETQNESSVQRIEEPEPQTSTGGSKLPFKFLTKKKAPEVPAQDEADQSGAEAQNSIVNDTDTHNVSGERRTLGESNRFSSSQVDLDHNQTTPTVVEVEPKPAATKPRFGFLNKVKLQVDQDNSMNQASSQLDVNIGENPNENTLNLSPVDKDKSFNVQGDLADTLDRYDSGGQTPQVEKRQTPEMADFAKSNLAALEEQQEVLSARSLELQAEQEQAIANEQYIEADALEQAIAELAAQVEDGKVQAAAATKEIEALEAEAARLASIELAALEQAGFGLEKFAKEVESHRLSFEQREQSRLRHERGFLDDEAEQLKISREHIEVNVKHVEEERESTERGIERQTKDYQLEQDRLNTTNNGLLAEIEVLRRQLDAKLAEQERVAAELAVVDEKIEAVRSKFKKQLDRVSKKQEKALEERSINDQEMTTVKRKLAELDEEEGRVKQAVTKYIEQQNQAQTLKDEIAQEMTKLRNRSKVRESLTFELAKSKEIYDDEAAKLKQLTDSLTKTESTIKKLDLDIEGALDTIRIIQEKLPSMERDKKAAAAARNFLEANKLSKDIKEKKEEIEREERRIAELRSEREEVQNKEPEKLKEAQLMREKLTELKKHYDLWNYRIECLRIEDLERILNSNFELIPRDVQAEYQYSIQKRDHLYSQYKDDIDAMDDVSKHGTEQTPEVPDTLEIEEIEPERKDTVFAEELAPEEELAAEPEAQVEALPEPPRELTEEEKEVLRVQVANLEAQIEEIDAEFQRTEVEINEASENDNFELAEELNQANIDRKSNIDVLRSQIEAMNAKISGQKTSNEPSFTNIPN